MARGDAEKAKAPGCGSGASREVGSPEATTRRP